MAKSLLSKEYWTERAERVILAGEKTALEMSRDLKINYDQATKRIQKEIKAFYGKYAKETGLDDTEVRKLLNKTELKTAKEQIKEYYDEVAKSNFAFDPNYRKKLSRQLSAKAYMSRLEELQMNIQHEIEVLYAKEQDMFKENLESTFEDSFYNTVFNIQQGIGISSSFTALNTTAIEKAVSQKWAGEDNYSSRIWNDKELLTRTLNLIIPQGFILGKNPKIIGKEISDATGTRLNASVRLARTEFNFVANQATKDAYTASGVVDTYQISATLDNRTSPICQEIDNKIFDVKNIEVAVNYPPFHPNCRTTTIPYFEPDEIDAMFDDVAMRTARGEDGKSYLVPADLSYKEWKNGLTTQENGKVKYKKRSN